VASRGNDVSPWGGDMSFLYEGHIYFEQNMDTKNKRFGRHFA
jgi:hypothetical protein